MKNYSWQHIVFIHLLLLLAKVILVSIWDMELHYEEMQYWLWSEHLDLSYYSKPGMVAWMNALSTAVFGNTELGVKMPALVAGFLLSIGSYLLAIEMTDNRKIGFWASLLVYIMPFYYSVSFFHSTDTYLCVFLLFTMLFFWRGIKHQRLSEFALAGVFLGLAMLSKYAAIFFIPFALIYLLINKASRKSWAGFGITILLLIVFCAPIIIWNIKYDWVSFKHVGNLGSSSDKEFNVLGLLNSLAEYVGGQAAIVSPFLVLFFIFGKKHGFLKEKRNFLTLFAWICFIFFLILTITKQKAANVNWPMAGYVGLPVFFATIFQKWKWKKLFVPAAVIMALFIGWTAFFKTTDFIKLESDPRYRYLGWKDMADAAWQAKEKYGPETIIVASNYQAASATTFYLRDRTEEEVHFISDGGRMNQLFMWNSLADYANQEDLHIIYIDWRPIRDVIKDQFVEIISEEKNEIKIKGRTVKEFYVVRAKGSKAFDKRPQGY